jgi:hypothetical protein
MKDDSSSQGMQAAMYMCASVAVVGVMVSYIFTPTYDSQTLEEADGKGYIGLDHACLQPSLEELGLLDSEQARRYSNSGGYEMLEIVQASHDYALTDDYETAAAENPLIRRGNDEVVEEEVEEEEERKTSVLELTDRTYQR